jgi:nitrogen fixation protein NifB
LDEQAHERVGRVHLPVAPRCNIQCAFCERKVCANLTMQHPGWTRQLLSPEEAAELVRRLVCSHPGEDFVVGVAGPGEPLENAETFEALSRVHQAYPALLKCVSTNGLLLERKLPQLLDAGVTTLTVTVNAPDGTVGGQIYAWVRHQGVVHRGEEAAELLIASQLQGIRAALGAGLALKVNTVLIPGVNDQHLVRLAHQLREIGVRLMNIMPLIPSGHMKDRRAPTCDELRKARSDCEEVIPQFRRCEQCRADVIRFPQHKR